MQRLQHLRALERDGVLLADAVAATTWDSSVPACPGWTTRDLVVHQGRVHRWAAGYVRDGGMERTVPGDVPAPATDAELLGWFREGHAELVRTLAEARDDVECWQFMPHLGLTPVEFWTRRQAHETAIHRVDAQQAATVPVTPVEPGFAVDGVHELLTGFLAQPRRRTRGAVATVQFRATDTGDVWHVRTSPEEHTVSATTADAPVTVHAPAADLYLALWNRGDLVAVDGDTAEWDRWRVGAAI